MAVDQLLLANNSPGPTNHSVSHAAKSYILCTEQNKVFAKCKSRIKIIILYVLANFLWQQAIKLNRYIYVIESLIHMYIERS